MIGFLRLNRALIAFVLMCICNLVQANALVGKKQVLLVDKKGHEILIGTIEFIPQNVESRYELAIDHKHFRDYFLSMKEMKCLEGPELWCHLGYPYYQPRFVTVDDLTWLSHDLLFMFKKKGEFGANFWNGIYYHMHIDGDVIRGVAQAVDLNELAAPPEDHFVPPLDEWQREEIDRDSRWLPDLIIR